MRRPQSKWQLRNNGVLEGVLAVTLLCCCVLLEVVHVLSGRESCVAYWSRLFLHLWTNERLRRSEVWLTGW